MERENDIDFISLLQDQTFLDLVKESIDFENQLDFLEQKYPGKRDVIVYAVEFIKVNLSEQKKIHADDVAQMLQDIRNFSDRKRKGMFRRILTHNAWKVAAAIAIVFACSILIYQQFNKDTLKNFASRETVFEDEAVLILSDGSKYKLNEYDSKIEYSADGGNIVVRNKRDNDEKLENAQRSNKSEINQMIVPYGHRHSILLSDGTQVKLNSGSKLVFPAEFSGKTREVYLIGEGYFEVSKNEDKPFIVKTERISIKVLGTEFNVSAYADEQVTSAVLVKGSVSVSPNGKIIGNTGGKLTPEQGFFYFSETSTSEIKQVDVADYTSWKDGLLRFKDQPLSVVVQRVRKYYNKTILIEGERMPATLISGKLVLTDDIESLLHYLSKTLEATYEIKDDGTYLIKEE